GRALSGRPAARVDVHARRRIGRPDFPRAVEPRKGARGARERALQEGQQMRKAIVLAFLLTATVHADVAELRRYVTTLASQRFGGRQTGTEGERLAREFLIAELKRIGAKPLPGQRDFALPFE